MLARRGQTILEYTIIVGIVAVVLSYMGVTIKRGLQSLVKVTADQVGNQQNADQDFNDAMQGYMLGTNAQAQENRNNQKLETGYITNTGQAAYEQNESFNESTYMMTNTLTNGGFSPSQ